MAHDCNGIWESWIDPPPFSTVDDLPHPGSDWWFFIDREDANGRFIGTHLRTFARLSGECKMTPHEITFHRTETNTTFVYYGEIDDSVPGFLIARGKRAPLFRENTEVHLRQDEEWVAVKTT